MVAYDCAEWYRYDSAYGIVTSMYIPRIVDDELAELSAGLPAIALEGAKGVGKTATAQRTAVTVFQLDEEPVRIIARADPKRLVRSPHPVLLDEWQRVPALWDLVRRSVDEGAVPGQFLLTGSASADHTDIHSGAGRIVSIHMRPLTLAERGCGTPTVSLTDLLSGKRSPISGTTDVALEDYVREIVTSGFPGLRNLSGRTLRSQLGGYISRIANRDFLEQGHRIRKPQSLHRWMAAYAAATSTTTSYEKIRDAATAGESDKPAKKTTMFYREILERLWILDPIPAWIPTRNHLRRLGEAPKHHLVDPALAARLLGLGTTALLEGEPGPLAIQRDSTALGQLFESLVSLNVRVYAQAKEATIGHLRTQGGEHEVDLIVERDDHRIVAIEVKLAQTVSDDDVRQLRWLQNELGDDLLDAVIVTTGPHAYRRRNDNIAVVPAALLGP